ncbi:aminotransferase class IV [Larkinella terrae]|uniref:branched-chain-amino-acid transaminase n=1 Tax=Larkinella terrae TaxID=2025311 RepID=A0A7K0ER34_9BACT|nr:aminotransferase class IV [Larkinella terrae]MRS64280.1 aminotransferase IV [Larkinella terrae]
MNVVLNGDVLPEEAICLSPNDRAFQYGDGLFETLRYEQNEVRFWPDHYDRVTRGMDALALRLPPRFDRDLVLPQIHKLLHLNGLTQQTARIKLQVWRQPGGLYTPTSFQTNFLITARSGSAFAVTEKTAVGFFDAVRLSPSPVSAYKTLNALPYVLAGIARQKQQADDMILLDTHGHLSECIASNLFWLIGNQLITPSPDSGCIEGILRRQLIRLAPQHGLTVHQGLFLPDVLTKADSVFCTNVSGIQWIRQIGETIFDESPQNRLQPVFAEL